MDVHRLSGPPRAVLLDAMGTLVELEPPAPRLRALLADRYGIAVGEAEAGAALAAEIAYYRAHLLEGRDAESLAALRSRCAEVLRAALPGSPALAAVDRSELCATLLDALRFRAYPDAAAALGALRARGLRLVVASNWDCSLPEVLARVGLAEMIDGVVASATVGEGKPGRAVFDAALALAGVEAAAAVHVGDRLDEDVSGARAAGLRVILLARDGGADAAAAVPAIRSLAELPGLLENLGAQGARGRGP